MVAAVFGVNRDDADEDDLAPDDYNPQNYPVELMTRARSTSLIHNLTTFLTISPIASAAALELGNITV